MKEMNDLCVAESRVIEESIVHEEEMLKMQRDKLLLAYSVNDTETIHAYNMRELGIMDWKSGRDHSRKEERQEEKLKAARNALSKGISEETINKITGLDIGSIRKIENDLPR